MLYNVKFAPSELILVWFFSWMWQVGSYSYDSSKMLFITKSAQYQKNGRNTIALDYDIGTQSVHRYTLKSLCRGRILGRNQNKSFSFFLLAIYSRLDSFDLRFISLLNHATSYVFLQTHTTSSLFLQFSYCTL